jgi:anti-sigma28 factor (negative regulator of flagellin synthesis)
MIISRAEVRSAVSAYGKVKRKSSLTASSESDRLEASSEGASLSALVTATMQEPFYRQDVVEDLGRRISEGRYFVPAEEIVDKMLGRLLVESMVS